MRSFSDFVQLCPADVSESILSCLNDPTDVVRASCVSRSWHRFVIENEIGKKLCLKHFPEVSSAAKAIEVDGLIQPRTIESRVSMVLGNAKRNHNVYVILAHGLSTELREDCIGMGICATSTDNYAVENIHQTINPNDRAEHGPSYWCSAGECDDGVPEKLIYTLTSDLCFVSEINIQPFQAYFQQGSPIYSAKAVRFRLGYPKSPSDVKFSDAVVDDARHWDRWYEWTYVSPEFAMAQENQLQRFKLPVPVLCIGGILQIELLGRAQRQASNGLFYICVQHVRVVGRTLSSEFVDVMSDHPGSCVVNYYPSTRFGML